MEYIELNFLIKTYFGSPLYTYRSNRTVFWVINILVGDFIEENILVGDPRMLGP